MNKILRNLRVALGIGLIWAVLWVVLGAVVVTIIGIFDPGSIDPGEGPLALAPKIGLAGFVYGVAFGGLLSIMQRRKTILELPLTWVAVLGALTVTALLLLIGKDLRMAFFLGPFGAVSAMASIVIARKLRRLRFNVKMGNC